MVSTGAHGHTHLHLPVVAELIARGIASPPRPRRRSPRWSRPRAQRSALVAVTSSPDVAARRAEEREAIRRAGGAAAAADVIEDVLMRP